MVSKRNKAKKKQQKTKRAAITAAKDYAQTISVPDLGYTESNPPPFDRVVGSPISVPGFADDIATNLTILDSATGAPVLQLFKPTSSQKKSKAIKSAEEGLKKYKEAQKADKNKKKTRGQLHFGIWNEMGNFKYNFTRDTTHNDKSVPLLTWARDHSNDFLNHLIPLLHPDWKQNLSQRPAGIKYLRDFFQDQVDLLPDYWSTCTFFNKFTGSTHDDPQDTVPSFLFNFGASTMLRLTKYGIDVQIDPLDVVVFNTSNYHMTWDPEFSNQDGKDRWAFSAFMRDVFFRKEAPNNISDTRLQTESHPPKKKFRAAAH